MGSIGGICQGQVYYFSLWEIKDGALFRALVIHGVDKTE